MVKAEHWMGQALAEGRSALPACLPNPPVGCVLVRDGAIIARGHTGIPYAPHAEPAALAKVEGPLDDVTAFVTLEPCAYHGRTPSCAAVMIRRRVGIVHVAMLDPHPKNRGAGIATLRDAGVTVHLGLCEREARADLAAYLWKEGDEIVLRS
jgi:pyrimidine deaminase RibD-like protein